MASLTTIIPFGVLEENDDDEDYPFAMVFSEELTFEIPRVVPIDVSQIPIASLASSFSCLPDESLPVTKPRRNKSGELVRSESSGLAGSENLEEFTSVDTEEVEVSSQSPRSINGEDDFHDFPVTPESVDHIGSSRSSEFFPGGDEGELVDEAPIQTRRQAVVTFMDPVPGDVVEEDNDHLVCDGPFLKGATAVRPGKKGTCYLCRKENKMTDKEMCIVCGAKYCSKCLIRAMGCMPEGRKCVVCVGKKIDETSRKRLGKSSRMLRRIFPSSEVKRILEMEKNSEPELIHVNLQPLSRTEYLCLRNCQYPPKNLKPENYWYDRLSGLWGKVGRKPCQIISPQLPVGGSRLQMNASNGDTNVLVNDREITKPELKMLQAAGINCKGHTSLWVTADGSYQDEGMGIVKGRIWDSTKVRIVCALLSLPVPPRYRKICVDKTEDCLSINRKPLYKLLLMGCARSGTSTIFKQAKMIYKVPFTREEQEAVKSTIQCNLYKYLAILLEAREQFERESLIEAGTSNSEMRTRYSLAPRLKYFSEWLQQVMIDGSLESIFPAATRENAPIVQRLWEDSGFQAAYARRHQLKCLPLYASHFLERTAEIARADYEPSDADILYAEGIFHSKGVSTMEFSSPKVSQDDDLPSFFERHECSRFQLVQVNPMILGGNLRRLEMFEDVDIVLFCVAITDYSEFSHGEEGAPANKMMANKALFETVVTHSSVANKKVLLVLNKFDLFEERLKEVPLSCCEWFSEFLPVTTQNPNSSKNRGLSATMAHRAFQLVATKFKRLYRNLTNDNLYVSLVSGLECGKVDEMLRYAWEIMRWNEEESSFKVAEHYSTSMEDSSS